MMTPEEVIYYRKRADDFLNKVRHLREKADKGQLVQASAVELASQLAVSFGGLTRKLEREHD